MKVTPTPFAGLLIIEPIVRRDDRGLFFESYNKETFRKAGINVDFVQDNQSRSVRNVIRGLHFQNAPYAQTKLIRVLSGTVQDVVLDLRKAQPTFGKYFTTELSAENSRQLLVPPGFAHGFLTLSEFADLLYKSDAHYQPESEGGILFSDPDIGIRWNVQSDRIMVSDRDRRHPTLVNAAFSF